MGRGRIRAVSAVALAVMLALAGVRGEVAGQQTGTVRGTITEAGTGQPLVGVQVSIRSTQLGGLTDGSGTYIVNGVPVGGVTVRVESIGYRTVEQPATVRAGEATVVDFAMQPSAIGLDEIVVTGTAGRTTKRAIGNSVSSIQAAELTEVVPISNVQQLLQGRTPGVTLLASSGVVGGSSKFRIRGSSSLTAGNEPVVYLDGIRIQSGTASTSGTTAQGINLLEAINPSDIESVEVIKGPAAATLYGAEAATGVIQIITKKGRPSEGMQWNLSTEYGQVEWAVDKITNYWLCPAASDNHPIGDRMGSLNSNPGCAVFDAGQPLSERLLVDHPFDMGDRSPAVYRQLEDAGLPVDRYACRFPQQQPCQPEPLRTGDLWNTNLSVRGGGQSYNFYISGEKSDEQGTFFNNFNRRTSGRANFGFVPSPKTNFGVNFGYAVVDQQTPQSDNSSNSILRNAYRGQAGGRAGQYLAGFRNFMPEFSNKYDRTQHFERLTMAVTGNYNPWPWFQNKLTVGVDRNDRTERGANQIDLTGRAPFGSTAATGTIDLDYTETHLWTVDYSGTISLDLSENWSSAFSSGMQMVKRSQKEAGISGNGLVANNLNLVSAAAVRNASQDFEEQTSLGFYVQEQIGWRDRLFATAAVRVDDNSAFGRDFSLVVYPKASLSYVISEEDFFDVGLVDELKLRGAWGQAGNAPGPFSADRTYTTGRTVVADAAVNRLQTSAFGNPDLKAETGQEIELGFDASLLQGRVGMDFTFYHKTTKDALLNVADPPSSGWTGNHLVNVGEIRNVGIELAVDASVVRTPNVQWDVIASIGTNANELVSFGRDAQGNPILLEDRFGEFLSVQRHREGFPLGGYWATDVKRDASGVPILNAAGQAEIVDCVWDLNDRSLCQEEYLGPSLPTRTIGLTNSITLFNNLRLYGFLDYQGGHWQWCAICSVRTRIDRNSREVNDPDLTPVELARLLSLQTKEYIYRADFIKLRELSATYTLPRMLTTRFGVERASLTLSGRNLFLWTDYGGPSDPDVAFNSTSSFGSTDYASIPQQRRWLVSMNFSF